MLGRKRDGKYDDVVVHDRNVRVELHWVSLLLQSYRELPHLQSVTKTADAKTMRSYFALTCREDVMGVLAFILYLIVAALCAWIADYLVPGTIPGGFFVAMIVGILGAWVGTSLMGALGPSLAGVAILPAIIGSAIVIFVLHLVGRATRSAP